jgi:hypothetical protein
VLREGIGKWEAASNFDVWELYRVETVGTMCL